MVGVGLQWRQAGLRLVSSDGELEKYLVGRILPTIGKLGNSRYAVGALKHNMFCLDTVFE